MMKKNILLALALINVAIAFAQHKHSEVAYTIDKYQPVGVTISSTERTFISFPNWLPDYRHSVIEIFPDGKYKPYPNTYTNNWIIDKDNKQQFISVQNVIADSQNNLWILDPANPQLGESIEEGIKLVKINLESDSISRVYYFPKKLVSKNSFLNDVRIDEKHQMAYRS